MKILESERTKLEARIGKNFSQNWKQEGRILYREDGKQVIGRIVEITPVTVESEIGLQYCLAQMDKRDGKFDEDEAYEIEISFGRLVQKLVRGRFRASIINDVSKFTVAYDTPGRNLMGLQGPSSLNELVKSNYVPVVDIHTTPKPGEEITSNVEKVHILRPELIMVQGHVSNQKGCYAFASNADGGNVRYRVFVSEVSAKHFPSKKVAKSVSQFSSFLATNGHSILDIEPLHNCSRERYRDLISQS